MVMANLATNSKRVTGEPAVRPATYWRVEGSLLRARRDAARRFFTWNSQSFAERWARRAGMAGMALVRPFAYAANRTFATRFLHTLLRGVSRDRLDLLGEEYFHYVLKPQLRREAAEKLIEAVRRRRADGACRASCWNISCGRWRIISELSRSSPTVWNFATEERPGGCSIRSCVRAGRSRGLPAARPTAACPAKNLSRQLGWTERSVATRKRVANSRASCAARHSEAVALFGDGPRS